MKFSTAMLSYFVEVCREKGFSQAAAKLQKSQSAVSTQIALLEKDLRLKLFDRSKRPLVLTEAGEVFLDFATEVLSKSKSYERYLSELSSGIAGEVRIGASTSVGTYILPGIISRLLRQFPKLKISLSTQPRSSVVESIRRADVDFGLVLSDRPSEGLSCHTLKTENLCLFVSPSHVLARKRSLNVTGLSTIPFVLGPQGTEYTGMVTRALSHHGLFNYAVAARISNFEGVKEVVQAGVGIGVLPRFMIRQEIREGTLNRLKINGFDARADIMHIERLQHPATPTMQRVKNFITKAVIRF
jgi:LysR family transcriptional regulator, transcriptional activator of the cysJI operon